MDCCAICAASSYAIKPLYESFKANHQTTLFRDSFHVVLEKDGLSCDAFFFAHGAAVFWGLGIVQGLKILEEDIAPLQHHHVKDVKSEIDEFTFSYGDTAKIFEDHIILPNYDLLTKFAFSQGISQSVKLGTFESRLQRTFNATKQIPEDLAEHGKISLSRKEIRKKMGQLFIERNSINLHLDVLDTPEFFWEYPELEPYYSLSASYLDIVTRVEILNHRLDVIHDLFEMLGTELNNSHSSRLEWIIIILIVIEVVLTLLKDVFQIL